MKHVINILKGMVVGIANVIPGVSGGTMAFILKIYDQLMESIGEFFTNKKKRKEYIIFLLTIFIGAGVGIILFARVMTILMEVAKQPTYFFFAGLIAGSIPFILKIKKDMKPTAPRIVSAIVGFVLIMTLILFSITRVSDDNDIQPGGQITQTEQIEKVALNEQDEQFVEENSLTDTLMEIQVEESDEAVVSGSKLIDFSTVEFRYGMWLLVIGFFAAGSMIVPGFSGSALLVTLGEYENILRFVDQRMIIPIGFVGVGAVLGILIFARVIDFFLKKFPSETIYFILGLIFASFYQIWLEIQVGFSFAAGSIALSAAALGIGFGIAYFLSGIKAKS